MDIGRHGCTWFDDGDGVELLCVCGARAVAVREGAEEDGERVLVVLAGEPVRLAVSA